MRSVHRFGGDRNRLASDRGAAARPCRRKPMLAVRFAPCRRRRLPRHCGSHSRSNTPSACCSPIPDKQHAKFVAAEPRDQIVAPQLLGHSLGRGLQQPVASRVAQAVVHLLEAIQIDDRQPHGRPPRRFGHRATFQTPVPGPTIGHSGQRIGLGQLRHLLVTRANLVAGDRSRTISPANWQASRNSPRGPIVRPAADRPASAAANSHDQPVGPASCSSASRWIDASPHRRARRRCGMISRSATSICSYAGDVRRRKPHRRRSRARCSAQRRRRFGPRS